MKANSIFHNKNYMLLLIGKLVSQIGDAIYLFSITWYILDVTGSTIYCSLFSIFGLLPSIIVMPFAGVFADRFDRKKIIVVTDLARGVILLIMAFLFQFNLSYLYTVYIASILISIFGSLFDPAVNSLMPNIVEDEHLVKANSMSTIVSNISIIIGVLCGGFFYNQIGIIPVLFLNSASFIFSGISEIFIKQKAKSTNFKSEIISKGSNKFKKITNELLSGYYYLRDKQKLFTLFLYFIFVNFLTSPLSIIYLPYIFNSLLHAKPIYLSIIQLSYASGYIIGSIVLSQLRRKVDNIKMIIIGIMFEGIFILILAIPLIPIILNYLTNQKVIILYILFATLLGSSVALVNVYIQVIFQRTVNDSFRGRVSALLNTFSKLSMPVAYMLGGTLAYFLPMYLVIIITAIILIILTTTMFRNKKLNNHDDNILLDNDISDQGLIGHDNVVEENQ